MRQKFRLSVVLLALAAFVAVESQAEAGHHRRRCGRRGGCGGCQVTAAECGGCAAPCGTAHDTAPDAAVPGEAAPAPPAPQPSAAVPTAPAPAPIAIQSTGSTRNVVATRPMLRRAWRR